MSIRRKQESGELCEDKHFILFLFFLCLLCGLTAVAYGVWAIWDRFRREDDETAV